MRSTRNSKQSFKNRTHMKRNVIKRFEFHVDIFSPGQTEVRANCIDMIARFFEENHKCRVREREK